MRLRPYHILLCSVKEQEGAVLSWRLSKHLFIVFSPSIPPIKEDVNSSWVTGFLHPPWYAHTVDTVVVQVKSRRDKASGMRERDGWIYGEEIKGKGNRGREGEYKAGSVIKENECHERKWRLWIIQDAERKRQGKGSCKGKTGKESRQDRHAKNWRGYRNRKEKGREHLKGEKKTRDIGSDGGSVGVEVVSCWCVGGVEGRVIRGHLCGLRRQSSVHNGAMQFTSMKNRCSRGMKWHMHLQGERWTRRAGWLWKQTERPGEMTGCVCVCVCVHKTTIYWSASLISLFNRRFRTAWTCQTRSEF